MILASTWHVSIFQSESVGILLFLTRKGTKHEKELIQELKKQQNGASKLVQNHIPTAKKTELKQQTTNVQNNSITTAAGGVNRGASCMFALFIDSLSPIKNRHHLTGSPLTATEGEETTLRTDKQCKFISFLLHCGHRRHCVPAFPLLPPSMPGQSRVGGGVLLLTLSKVLLLGEPRRARISFPGELVS